MNSVNPMQLIQLIKGGINPQQLVMNFLQQNGNNNPILQNVNSLAQGGNIAGLQQIARNLAQQKGLDFEQSFSDFKNLFP